MDKVWNLGRIGIAAICCLLMTTLFSSCEETYIHADRAMPGMWVIEDISVSKWRAIEIQSEDALVMCMPIGWFGRFIRIM